ncbi:hypothetical protein G6F22_014425 [Rhizopus arrhizus]|nr:hypothetical protein G6F22_014425 [Rhizopus arrhizus]
MDVQDHEPEAQHSTRQSSLLVFRLGREWLGLPTRALDEVAGTRPVLTLPHRRDPAVLGVTNVRGTLTVCVSLARLLGLDAAPVDARERAAARMLIFGGTGRAVVLPVDEVEGIHAVDLDALEPLPATVEGASQTYSRGMARCGGRGVGVLDENLLMQALERTRNPHPGAGAEQRPAGAGTRSDVGGPAGSLHARGAFAHGSGPECGPASSGAHRPRHGRLPGGRARRAVAAAGHRYRCIAPGHRLAAAGRHARRRAGRRDR